jgi:hypothetical protein
MNVTLNEIRIIFNNLINETISQEEDRIWKGIQYLLGVDLKEDLITYLHTVEDFRSYYDKFQF